MNSLRAEILEGRLVYLITYDNFKIIDTFDYDPETRTIFLESNGMQIEEDEISHIREIDDRLPAEFRVKGRVSNYRSNKIH